MRRFALVLAASLIAVTAIPAGAEAKGCIRGAVAGGVVGHYAGNHAIMGAVGGCIAARAYYRHKANQAAMARAHQGQIGFQHR